MQLVIDSATAACSAALIGPDGEIIDQRHEIVGRGHAERLLPMIADLLAGRVPDAILVDCGPGSFTGVRVGLAAAHGLAIGWKVPLAGYSSLASIARGLGRGRISRWRWWGDMASFSCKTMAVTRSRPSTPCARSRPPKRRRR